MNVMLVISYALRALVGSIVTGSESAAHGYDDADDGLDAHTSLDIQP